MKKWLWSICLLLVVTNPTAYAAKVVFTSNVPELYPQENGYALAKMASYIKRLKQNEPNTLFVHGGDSLSPNPLSVYDKGAHMISIMNSMTVDAMTVNRREFNDGIDQVTLLSSKAHFPMVLSNVYDKRTGQNIEGLLPYTILSFQDMKVALLMTVSEEVNTTFLLGQATVNETTDRIERLSQQARLDGAHYVMLVTESAYVEAVPINTLKGVDVVVITRDGKDKVISESPLVVSSGGVDDELAMLDFQPTGITAKIVHTSEQPMDQELTDVVNRYTSQLDVVLNQTLTTLDAPMDSLRSVLRSRESTWGNIVMDAVRQYTHSDLALMVGGSFRGYREYEKGYVIKRRDVQRELPFGGSVVVVDVTPEQLKAILEHGVSRVEKFDGRFLQASGLQYTFDHTRPIGSRVTKLLDEQGQPLNRAHYTLTISDYMLEGGDDYDFKGSKVVSDDVSSQRLIWNIVSDYLSSFKSIRPSLEGRISSVHPIAAIDH